MAIEFKANPVRYRNSSDAVVDNVMKLIEDAKALEEAGCFSFVIECVRSRLLVERRCPK